MKYISLFLRWISREKTCQCAVMSGDGVRIDRIGTELWDLELAIFRVLKFNDNQKVTYKKVCV